MTRDELIAAMQATAAEPPVPVSVPKWGTVYVRAMTVAEVEAQDFDAASKDKSKIARGAARVICDKSGKRVFDPESDADVALLASQPWSLLRTVLNAANPDPNP